MGSIDNFPRGVFCSQRAFAWMATLVVLALAGVSPPTASAQAISFDFNPNRDTNSGIPTNTSEDQINRGAAQSVRVGKGSNQDYYFADWDTAAIKSFIETEVGPVTTIGDLSNVTVELFAKASGGFTAGNKVVNIRTLNSTSNNWVEGNGNSSSELNWTQDNDADPNNGNNGYAATGIYARTYRDNTGTFQAGLSTQWQNKTGTNVAGFNNVPRDLLNSTQFVFLSGDTTNYNSSVLDSAIVLDLINNPLNIGLVFADDTDFQNVTLWTREAAAGNRPFLRVTVTTVPEPGTWALLALGAIGLLIVARRRYAVH